MTKAFTLSVTVLILTAGCFAQSSEPDSANPWPGCQAYYYFYFNDSIRTFAEAYPYNFVDQSAGQIVSWHWDFGDGKTSTEQNPLHFYSTAGDTVTVCLTITTVDGCTSQSCASFVVGSFFPGDCRIGFKTAVGESYPPVYIFTPDQQDSKAFYSWDFGDGTFSSEIIPAHRYEYDGKYIVCLGFTTPNGCTAYQCDTLEVTGSSNACKASWIAFSDVMPYPSDPGTRDTVFVSDGYYYFFQDQSKGAVTQWTWSFGDGSASMEQYPSHRYDKAGIYHVCLDIVTSNGCTSSYCDSLNVGVVPWCSLTGTVKDYTGLDGCGLLIVLDNGVVLEPAEIVPNFMLKSGQRVRLAYTELLDRASICMAGKIVRIDCIEEEPQSGPCDNFIKFNTEIILNGQTCNGSATATLVDAAGNEVYAAKYLWSTGENGQVIYDLCPGMTYSVIITDTSGCAVSGSFSFGGGITYPDSLIGYWNFEQDDMSFFFNVPVYADSIYCEWDFGDGSKADGPSVNHTYDSGDSYTVMLRVYTANGIELFNQSIPVSPGLYSRDNKLTRIAPEVYPVPASDLLYLKSPKILNDLKQIEILTSGGQVMMSNHPLKQEGNLLQLDVSGLPAGFYIGKLIYKNGSIQSFRFVK